MTRFVICAILSMGVLLMTPSKQAWPQESATVAWQRDVGAWCITFAPAEARLACSHAASGAEVAGTLSFLANNDGKEELWRAGLPRDSVKDRLALLDTRGEAQGYMTFSGTGDTLRIGVIHRAAQNYPGELRFNASAHLGGPAFACRTQPPLGGRVVQMAAGPADSRLNDSLFDMNADTVFRFLGRTTIIVTSGDNAFAVALTSAPNEPAHAEITLELISDYYRARYVPYYRPIDKQRCPKAPTGWMSWNVYFDTAGEKENLDEARIGAQYLKPFGLDIWSIESWQDDSPELPVSKFHNLTLRSDPNKFPSGMKGLADEIRRLGFKPGIWTVPFGTGDAAYYEAHKAWFLHDTEGKPMRNWCGNYLVDPSQEAVRQHMEESHRIMSQEWGYEYFKIDGMSGRNSGYSAHFYERDNVRANFKEACEDPFRLCVEALRRGIGPDRIWLACQGHYTGPEIGFADAGRLGADIVAHRRPPDWHNYANQARTTLNQLFVNNIVWYGDPDTLLVGAANSLETVRLAASVVALTGQAMFAGDKLSELPPERMRLLQQSLPVCDIRPLDLFPIFEMCPVWDLKIQRAFAAWDVVSLFNWSETPAEQSLRFDELGLDPSQTYLVYDAWNQSLYRGVRESFTTAVPGHGNALLSVHADTGRPQFVFSDRHLTQGGVELDVLAWNDAEKTLSGAVRLVENHPTELVFAVPEGYSLKSTQAIEGVALKTTVAENRVTLTLQQAASGTAAWTLQF